VGGPRTSILASGSFGLTSFQVFIGVGYQLIAALGIGHVLGQGQEDVLRLQVEFDGFLGVGDGDAIVTDLDLDDPLDPVLLTLFEFGALDAA